MRPPPPEMGLRGSGSKPDASPGASDRDLSVPRRTGDHSCAACGHETSPRARFCEHCGSALPSLLAAPPAPADSALKIPSDRVVREGERKQITVMFVDIVNSMALASALDPERWRDLLDRFLVITSRAVHGVEGTVHQFTGDGVMALFGAPLAHEDHPRRACLAALELQRGVALFAQRVARDDGIQFSVRCGLNSGEVIIGMLGEKLRIDYASVGVTNGLAKRMESLAPSGSIALSSGTAKLVAGEFALRELGEYKVKGVRGPQLVYELGGRGPAQSRLEAAAQSGLSSFVGRRDERGELEAALDEVIAGDGRIVGISGEPGIGKSRLCLELLRHCRERGVAVYSTSAVAHGQSVPLLPIRSLLRDCFGIAEDDSSAATRERVREAVLEFDPGFGSELRLLCELLGVADPTWAVEPSDPEVRGRRLRELFAQLIEARARHEATVILIEDVHWIDVASAAFLQELARAVDGMRILLLLTFRPEYEPTLGPGVSHKRIKLGPLGGRPTNALVRELLGADDALGQLSEMVERRAAGNPLFVEEIVRGLAEQGLIVGRSGSYTLAGSADEIELPDTIQALLGARIDRLRVREKELLQTMSVIGTEVSAPILSEVCDLDTPELAASLEALGRAGFITAGPSGSDEHVFSHPCVYEVAYESQLSRSRSRAHVEIARVIERVYQDRLDERAALIAHHLEAGGAKLAAARWHARAARWVASASPAASLEHWRSVCAHCDELVGSEEARQLAALARVSILSLSWRIGLAEEEFERIHAEGEALLADAGMAASPQQGETEMPEQDSSDKLLLDFGRVAYMSVRGGLPEALEFVPVGLNRARRLGDPGAIAIVNGLAAVTNWLGGSLSEGLGFADRGLEALAGDGDCSLAERYFKCPEGYVLWVRGACAGWMGRLAEADAAYARAIELCRQRGDPEVEALSLSSRARLFSEVGNHESALHDCAAAIGIAEGSGNEFSINVGRATKCLALARSAAYEEAIDLAVTVLPELRTTGRHMEPLALSAIATASLGLGQSGNALEAAERGARLAHRLSLGAVGIFPLVVLARSLLSARDLERALQVEAVLEHALQRVDETGARVLLPQIYVELAALNKLRGEPRRATAESAKAARLMARMGKPPAGVSTLSEPLEPMPDPSGGRLR